MNSYEPRLNALTQATSQLTHTDLVSEIKAFALKWSETYALISKYSVHPFPLLGGPFTREYSSCTMHERFSLVRFLIWGLFRTRLSFPKLIVFLLSFLCFCCSLNTQYATRTWNHNGCASLHSRTRFDFLLIELTTHLTHTRAHTQISSRSRDSPCMFAS